MKRQHPENPDLFWCSSCKSYRLRSDFSVDERRNHPRGWCIRCERNKAKEWALKNPERKRLWREQNKGRLCELQKKYYRNDPDKYREMARQYRREHRVEVSQRNKVYTKNHPEKQKIWNKRTRSNNPELYKEIARNVSKRAVSNLRNSYIKGLLSHQSIPITGQSIELKRHQILALRKLKELKEVIKNVSMDGNV